VDLSRIDCERALKAIELFLDGELDPVESELLRAHLGDCPPCGNRAEFQRRLKGLLARTCSQEAPASLQIRVQRITLEGRPHDGSP
jgi:mycothiol system anti-sigma-R factor